MSANLFPVTPGQKADKQRLLSKVLVSGAVAAGSLMTRTVDITKGISELHVNTCTSTLNLRALTFMF